MRYRITVRGDGIELRGYLDDDAEPDEDMSVLRQFGQDMSPFGIVVASPVADDYDPFTDNPADDWQPREPLDKGTVCSACGHSWNEHDGRDERAPDRPCCMHYAGMGEPCGCNMTKELEALADEAERGYDPATIKPAPPRDEGMQLPGGSFGGF